MQLELNLNPGEIEVPTRVFRFYNLASGSAGNATVVESVLGRRVLVDCGLGLREIEQRLVSIGAPADSLDAIFVTHEHGDHLGSALSLAAKHRIPVYMSAGTRKGACAQRDRRIGALGSGPNSLIEQFEALSDQDLLRVARSGVSIAFGDLTLQPFAVPHDTPEPLQLCAECGGRRLGILTDLGHVTPSIKDALEGCAALLLEANHCSEMLALGPYPEFLKHRVGGRTGHLANAQSAALLGDLAHPGLHTVIAAHLSQQNNEVDRALASLRAALPSSSTCHLRAATQTHGSAEWIAV